MLCRFAVRDAAWPSRSGGRFRASARCWSRVSRRSTAAATVRFSRLRSVESGFFSPRQTVFGLVGAKREGRAGARGRECPSRDGVLRYDVTVAGQTAVGRTQAVRRAVGSERSRSVRVHASACPRFERRLPDLATVGPRVGCPRWRMSVGFGRRGIDHRGISLLVSRFGPVTAHRFGGGSGCSEASVSR